MRPPHCLKKNATFSWTHWSRTAKELPRVDDMRQVPAAVRFLSCEPLLGPLDGLRLDGIHWVIAGGGNGGR